MLKETGTWGDEEAMNASTFFHLQKVTVGTHGSLQLQSPREDLVPQSTSARSSALP